MDNLAAHKKAGVREAIQSCGATLVYLMTYRPDFNSTELLFAKLKGLLRSAEERTVPDLWQRLGEWIDRSARMCQRLSPLRIRYKDMRCDLEHFRFLRSRIAGMSHGVADVVE